ncbi:MAG: lipoprotein-releasing system transmembrane subunit LolC, partial [Alphaproteobacteria bacterium]|nr:lipoprotein-releasing system transmembrane subunit LolC [Alphaproteobacteria bacterium]
LSAAPLIQAPVYATTPLGEEAVLVRAMHREDLLNISAITSPENITQGSFENFGVGKSGGNHIAIGSRLAGALGVQAGSGVTLITGGGSETAFGRIPIRSKTYVVGAVFKVDNSQYDSTIIFMPYAQAQLFFQASGAAEQIEIRISDPDQFDFCPPYRQ